MNDTLVNIITNIIYIVALLIIVILTLSLINYILYTIYSIKEIIIHNTSEDAIHYKLRDIYNYKLINYINIINTDNNYKYDMSCEFNNTNPYLISMKDFTLTKIETANPPLQQSRNYIDISYLDVSNPKIKKDNDVEFKLNNIDLIKSKDFMILYDNISYKKPPPEPHNIDASNLIVRYKDDNYSIKYETELYKANNANINININKSLYNDIVSFSKKVDTEKAKTTETDKKMIGNDGMIILYRDKYNDTQDINKKSVKTDIYGYILNGLYLLIPTTLLWSNDKYASGLYVKTNNDFYEIILLLVFVSIFIILIALINDFYTYIFNIAENSNILDELFITKIMNRNTHLVIISLCIFVYCILHSIIYFFVFINGTYGKIKGMYDDLTVADEYIRNEVNKHLISNNYNSDIIIEAFNDIAYGGDISYIKGKYNVIDGTTNEDIYDVKKKFEEKMIAINYSFSYDINIYNTDKYTNSFFTTMKNILYNSNITDSSADTNINKTIMFVLIVYLYFVKNNIDDPYILIKLNKLIFGRVANIGISEIDDEIQNTLTLRSLLGHNFKYDEIIDGLEYEEELIFDDARADEKNQRYKTDVGEKVKLFSNNLYVELNYWGAVYYFNLYLVLEIIIGCFVILIILIVIKYTDNDMKENIDVYIDKMKEFINTIIDEIKTAILGVI